MNLSLVCTVWLVWYDLIHLSMTFVCVDRPMQNTECTIFFHQTLNEDDFWFMIYEWGWYVNVTQYVNMVNMSMNDDFVLMMLCIDMRIVHCRLLPLIHLDVEGSNINIGLYLYHWFWIVWCYFTSATFSNVNAAMQFRLSVLNQLLSLFLPLRT